MAMQYPFPVCELLEDGDVHYLDANEPWYPRVTLKLREAAPAPEAFAGVRLKLRGVAPPLDQPCGKRASSRLRAPVLHLTYRRNAGEEKRAQESIGATTMRGVCLRKQRRQWAPKPSSARSKGDARRPAAGRLQEDAARALLALCCGA